MVYSTVYIIFFLYKKCLESFNIHSQYQVVGQLYVPGIQRSLLPESDMKFEAEGRSFYPTCGFTILWV